VNKLKSFGLLRLREQITPAHGVVQIVEPTARQSRPSRKLSQR